MKGRYRYIMLLICVLFLVVGCDELLIRENAPEIKQVVWTMMCGGEETIYRGGIYEGCGVAKLYVEFDTYNVNQEFDAYLLVESPLVPPEIAPIISSDAKFTTVSKNTGKASGLKRVEFGVQPLCNSSGPYELTVVITDAKGKNTTHIQEFSVSVSPMLGADDCLCVTQCGPCTFDFWTLYDRCVCGCPLTGEKCN